MQFDEKKLGNPNKIHKSARGAGPRAGKRKEGFRPLFLVLCFDFYGHKIAENTDHTNCQTEHERHPKGDRCADRNRGNHREIPTHHKECGERAHQAESRTEIQEDKQDCGDNAVAVVKIDDFVHF